MCVRELDTLAIVYNFEISLLNNRVRSFAFMYGEDPITTLEKETLIMAGLDDGGVLMIPFDHYLWTPSIPQTTIQRERTFSNGKPPFHLL